MVSMYTARKQFGLALWNSQCIQMLSKEGIQVVSYLFLAFMFLTLLVKRRIKLLPDRQAKLNALLQRRGKLVKIFAIGGAAISGTVVAVALAEYWMHKG